MGLQDKAMWIVLASLVVYIVIRVFYVNNNEKRKKTAREEKDVKDIQFSKNKSSEVKLTNEERKEKILSKDIVNEMLEHDSDFRAYPGMDYNKAQKIFFYYNDALVKAGERGLVAVPQSSFKYSRNEVVVASKVFVAHYTVFRYFKAEDNERIFMQLNRMNMIVGDEIANRMNSLQSTIREKGADCLEKKDASDLFGFIGTTFLCNEHDQIADVQSEVQAYISEYLKSGESLASDEPYRHIYEDIIGIKYYEDYGHTFYTEGANRIKS